MIRANIIQAMFVFDDKDKNHYMILNGIGEKEIPDYKRARMEINVNGVYYSAYLYGRVEKIRYPELTEILTKNGVVSEIGVIAEIKNDKMISKILNQLRDKI